MAFTPQNFGQIGYEAPTDQGFGQIFDRILKGYAGGMMPQRLQTEEELRQGQLGVYNRQANQPYSELGSLVQDYNNLNAQDDFKKALFEQALRASAQQGGGAANAGTGQERVARILNNPNIPESEKNVYRQLFGVPVNEGAQRPISQYPKAAQNAFRKENAKYLRESEDAVRMNENLDGLKQIILENPGMGNSFSLAFQSSQPEATLIEQFAKKGMDQKQLAAIQKFIKISNQLVADSQTTSGSARGFTDTRQRLFESIKPNIKNTDEANLYVIDNLKKMNEHKVSQYPKVLDAVREDNIYQPEALSFGERAKDFVNRIENNAEVSAAEFKTVRAPNGKLLKVPVDKLDSAINAGGVVVE